MINYFKMSEFIIDPDMDQVPLHVCDKIVEHHLPILNNIRHLLGVPVIISKHSGYRSVEWEYERGRSGNSQHTFKGKGAVDVRCNDKFDDLLDLLIDSDYTRVCYYPHHGFIHCDFKDVEKPQYFEADENGSWNFKRYR